MLQRSSVAAQVSIEIFSDKLCTLSSTKIFASVTCKVHEYLVSDCFHNKDTQLCLSL